MILIEELINRGIIDNDTALKIKNLAETKYNGQIDEAFAELKIDEEAVLEAKKDIFGVPIKDIEAKKVPYDTLKLIPIDAAKTYQFVPINQTDTFLEIGIVAFRVYKLFRYDFT